MPIPNPRKNEKDFTGRCMSDPIMKEEYPDAKQRVAICIQKSEGSAFEQASLQIQYAEAEYDDEWDEWIEEVELNELYDSESGLSIAIAAENKGKKVKLNKVMRGDVKKFKVYVKNDKGNVVKVNFGDPNMEIKRDDPERRKSFRARHNCDNPGPKWKARYWSCKMWSSQKVSDIT